MYISLQIELEKNWKKIYFFFEHINLPRRKPPPSWVARFFSVHDTKTGNSLPNDHKIIQMITKYSK
jgi:hypothetical protein